MSDLGEGGGLMVNGGGWGFWVEGWLGIRVWGLRSLGVFGGGGGVVD